jgi:5'-3' exonuclease
MGITNFYKWIKSEYGNSIKTIDKECFDHVYIDMNYLLHMCSFNDDDLDFILRKIGTIIIDICIKTQPSSSLNIFCDGTSPFAKLLIQRERRFNTQDKKVLNFTPGTKFIKSIPDKLKKIFDIIKNQFVTDVNLDMLEPGESEIKIKNKILENYNKDKNKSHILVTNDADVILILTSHESFNKCNILLHNDILSINKLLNLHYEKYCNNNKKSVSYNFDFTFLNLFLGNDYLPKLHFVTNKNLWESYKYNLPLQKENYLVKFINSDIQINYDFLFDIFNTLLLKIGRNKIKKINKSYDNNIYKNYFDGLLWNLKMYNTGICEDYYYCCYTKKPIDILNLILYLFDKKNNLEYNIINKPICSELCCILILPEIGKDLIDFKYHDFIEKINKKYNIYDNKFHINKENLDLIIKEFNELEFV